MFKITIDINDEQVEVEYEQYAHFTDALYAFYRTFTENKPPVAMKLIKDLMFIEGRKRRRKAEQDLQTKPVDEQIQYWKQQLLRERRLRDEAGR